MGIAQQIRQRRTEAGLSQEGLAALLGVDRSAVAQWETGKTFPKMSNVQKLATILGTTVSALLADSPLPESMVRMRALGKVHAGPFDDEEEYLGTIEVPTSILLGHPRAEAILVEGDCMDLVVPEGTAVVIDPDMEPSNGRMVVVETEDHKAVLRVWNKVGNTLVLTARSHSQDYQDIVVRPDETIRSVGVVIWFQSPFELGE